MHVLIAGGGPAALEAALALRHWAGGRVEVTLLAPSDRFIYPPLATREPFQPDPALARPLPVLASSAGANLHKGRLAAVDPVEHTVRTDDGEHLGFDALIVAVGARTGPALSPPALTFSAARDAVDVRTAVDDVAREALSGEVARLAFVVPPGPGWALPAYELALAAARSLEMRGATPVASVCLATPESRPLDIMGEVPSAAVAADLDAARVEFVSEFDARDYDGVGIDGLGGRRIRADRVVALPRVTGPEVPGLPQDYLGFVPATWDDSRVPGIDGVFAIGDASGFPVKQGGLACQQAHLAASSICGDLGIRTDLGDWAPALRVALWTGTGHRYMRRELGGGHEESIGVTSDREELWSPAAKIAGRFLPGLLDGSGRESFVDWSPRVPRDSGLG
ncbi:MAG: FAD-dependent oxidoreductase [Miltoncostaeaceae bacterium]